LEKEGILANRNMIFGDLSAIKPSAIRIGTYAVTSRGMREKEMKMIASLVADVLIKKMPPRIVQKKVEKLCLKFS